MDHVNVKALNQPAQMFSGSMFPENTYLTNPQCSAFNVLNVCDKNSKMI